MSGKKRIEKVYYHHTIYAGGLHEVPFKLFQEKFPEKLIKRTMRNMLPNIKVRDILMDR